MAAGFLCHDCVPAGDFQAMKRPGKGNGSGQRPAGIIGTAALLLGLCLAPPPAQAQTGPVVNGFGLCLQVNGAIASGSRLQSANCVPNAPNQTFTRTALNELRIAGTLCVDAYGGGKQAAEVGLWTCQNSLNERWAPNNGFLVTENNFCLAVDGGNRTSGTRIIVYNCLNDPSQKWTGPTAAKAPVTAPAPAPVTQPAATLDPGNLSSACQMLFGRDCSTDENAYVRGAPPANWVSRDAIMAFLRAREVVSSPGIRDAIVTRAVDLTYGAGAQICTEAWTYFRASFTTNASNPIGTSWNSFQQLYYSMNGQPAMLPAVINAQCKGAAPKVPGTAFDTNVAQNACQTMLGRVCQAAETAQLSSGVGGNNLAAMQNFIRDRWISASPAYKDNVILAAYAAVMGAGKSICTEEMTDLRARFATTPQPGITWSGYSTLAAPAGGQPALVQARSTLCVPPAPAKISSATLSMIANQYVADFGRQPTPAETTYWASVAPTDPRVASAAAFQTNDKTYLQSSQAERQALITRAYQATWGVAIPANSKEMQFWDPIVAKGQVLYSGIKRVNDQLKTANPTYKPGQAPAAKLVAPATYSLAGVEDGALGWVMSPLLGTLNFAFTVVATVPSMNYVIGQFNSDTGMNGPPPPAQASPYPTPLGRPAMRTTVGSIADGGLSGPFIIATTNHEDPTRSFCLDTQSWDAGSPVVAVPCHGGDSQLFMFIGYQIMPAKNAKSLTLCLDGVNKPKQLLLNQCTGTSKTQQWYVNTIPGINGASLTDAWTATNPNMKSKGQIQNIGNGGCIDLANGATGPVNPVITYDCASWGNQNPRQWNQVWGAGHIMQSGGAYIFFRYNPPGPAGHVAWGLQLADGTWEAGGFDGPEASALFNWTLGIVNKDGDNGAFRQHFPTEKAMIDFFSVNSAPTGRPGAFFHYDRYYRWPLTGTLNTAAVLSLEAQSWEWGYGVFGNNCMDITFKILRAYGFSSLLEPSHINDLKEFAPKTWFQHVLNGTEPLWLHGPVAPPAK